MSTSTNARVSTSPSTSTRASMSTDLRLVRPPTRLGRAARNLPFTASITTATARRVLQQIVHDRGSVALILAIPCMLMVLLKLMFDGSGDAFERIGPQVFGIFPLIVMYLVASVSTLRERTSGTAERLLTMPVQRLDIVLGTVSRSASWPCSRPSCRRCCPWVRWGWRSRARRTCS